MTRAGCVSYLNMPTVLRGVKERFRSAGARRVARPPGRVEVDAVGVVVREPARVVRRDLLFQAWRLRAGAPLLGPKVVPASRPRARSKTRDHFCGVGSSSRRIFAALDTRRVLSTDRATPTNETSARPRVPRALGRVGRPGHEGRPQAVRRRRREALGVGGGEVRVDVRLFARHPEPARESRPLEDVGGTLGPPPAAHKTSTGYSGPRLAKSGRGAAAAPARDGSAATDGFRAAQKTLAPTCRRRRRRTAPSRRRRRPRARRRPNPRSPRLPSRASSARPSTAP